MPRKSSPATFLSKCTWLESIRCVLYSSAQVITFVGFFSYFAVGESIFIHWWQRCWTTVAVWTLCGAKSVGNAIERVGNRLKDDVRSGLYLRTPRHSEDPHHRCGGRSRHRSKVRPYFTHSMVLYWRLFTFFCCALGHWNSSKHSASMQSVCHGTIFQQWRSWRLKSPSVKQVSCMMSKKLCIWRCDHRVVTFGLTYLAVKIESNSWLSMDADIFGLAWNPCPRPIPEIIPEQWMANTHYSRLLIASWGCLFCVSQDLSFMYQYILIFSRVTLNKPHD